MRHWNAALLPADRRPIPAAGVLRRLGRIGAVLALAVQLLLPFMAMPQAAVQSSAVGREAAALARIAALWGGSALCSVEQTFGRHGQQTPAATHQCPICWAVQQAASLLAPGAGPVPAPRAPFGVATARASLTPVVRSAFSPAQPRGPPLV